MCDKKLEKFLENIETKTGEPIKDEICDLLKKFETDSEEAIKKTGKALEKQLIKLSKLADVSDAEIKKIKKDILELKETKENFSSDDKKEYYDLLMDDIQYLIIYKLCFFMGIRKEEVDWIKERREITDKKVKNAHERTRNDPYNDAMGLALSGGGIRSATFNLGLLQALERCNILKSVDYLSTVSGGGYIGSSLTWFMSKDENSFPFGVSRKDHGGKSGKILSWLRDHGNYMAPGNGLDLPALIVAVLTSVLINILILVPLFLLVFWIFHKLLEVNFKFPSFLIFLDVPPSNILLSFGLVVLAAMFLLSVAVYVGSSLKKRRNLREWCRDFKIKKLHEVAGVMLVVGLLLLVFGMVPVVYDFLYENIGKWVAAISFSGLAAFGGAFKGLKESNETKGYRSALLTVGLTLIVFGVMLGLYHIIHTGLISDEWLFVLVLVSIVMALLVNINHISIHRYYRNRLMEAYMPWTIIGKDRSESDELPLAKIPKTRAPYHIINTTVNMVGSKKIKQRERGGDSFILSPLFCGSEATGYASTEEYIEGEVNLATALAVSGAAVNPNMYVTRSKPITFLMSLFNARLGYWIKKPSSASYDKNSFYWSYYTYMFREMFSGLDETKEYIHLSDGGHFENLGLYELVRRRCRYIIVSDAGNDPNWSFGDLARVIEMVRIDFGAEVNLDTRPLQPKGETRLADQGFIRGTITYKDGTIADLIYINTVVIDGLPEDIYSYRRTNPKFPEQTTADQFFDEKQFEAYRELGFQLGFDLCGKTSHQDFTAIFKNESKGTSAKV